MVCESDQTDPGILLPMPLGEERVFRNQAMDDVLELLYRNPRRKFGVRELRDITGHGAGTVDTALTLFDELGLIQSRRDGNKKLVSIDSERVQGVEDPLFQIPQPEFRAPAEAFLDRATAAQGENLVGVVLFGSVARGGADRTSDIDVQVIVTDGVVDARRELQRLRQDVEAERFDGERYELQLLVESVESITTYGEDLQDLFREGITLYGTDRLDEVKGEVLGGQ